MASQKVQDFIEEAKVHFSKHEYKKAYETNIKALELLKQETGAIQQKKQWAEIYLGIVESLDKMGDWLRALEYAGILISEARNKNNKKVEIKTRLLTCQVLLNKGNWDEAGKRYNTTLELAEKAGSDPNIAECYYGQAYIDWRKGDQRAARFKITKALDLLEGKQEYYLEARTRILLASIEDAEGNSEVAIENFTSAIEQLKKLEPSEDLARAHNNLGEVYKGIDEYETAAKQYEQCVKVAKKVKSVRGELYGLCNTAECYTFNGDTAKAKKLVKEIESILKRSKEKYILAQVPYIKGLIAHQEKEYERACDYYDKAVENLKKIGSPPYDVGIAYLRKGEALKAQSKPDRASDAFDRAERNFKKANAGLYLKKLSESR